MLAALLVNLEEGGHFLPDGAGAGRAQARHPVLPMLQPEIDAEVLLKKLRGDIESAQEKPDITPAPMPPGELIKAARAVDLENEMARAILDEDDEAVAMLMIAIAHD